MPRTEALLADSVEVKARIPRSLYSLVRTESKQTGVDVADIIRLALADRYRDRLFDADLARRDEAVREARARVQIAEVEK